MEKILRTIEKFIPSFLYTFFQPFYHYLLSVFGAFFYDFPSKKLIVIGVTGTKGKSTTAEIIYKIFKEAGFKVALANTVEFTIGDISERNQFKMTTPGRFFLQKFLLRALKEKCTHVVLELTSEAVLQSRHKFIYLDALVVTNISKEHIERHGSYENYKLAKLQIAKEMISGVKKNPILVTNLDDKELQMFRDLPISKQYTFSLSNFSPYHLSPVETSFTFNGKNINSSFVGKFNLENVAAAITLSEGFEIQEEKIISAISKYRGTLGRVQKIENSHNFTVIVDYAHTADSMKKLYETFPSPRICVFGATGGGRDTWKRPEMGKVASLYCDTIILTNDDPYDEDPEKIVAEIKTGIKNKETIVEIDRRKAIALGLSYAKEGSTVLITGKGTDPYLMEKGGKRTPWDDASITKEELQKINA